MNTKNLGTKLLVAYLILGGLIGLLGNGLGQLSFMVPLLALAAGVAIAMGK